MDYLRTLGSAAVSTLVQKSGLNLPFSLGPKLAQVDGHFTLYDATKRDDGSPVSVFEYDFGDPSRRNMKPFAQNSLRKLRTTRHPDVLKFMDAVESEATVYIMTERVRPLSIILPQYSSKNAQEREDWLLWGLHRISVALAFLNDQCLSTHGKLTPDSIFLSPSGEWKLGGFELLSNSKDEGAILYTMGGLFPGTSSWAPPEVKKSGWSSQKDLDPASADSYALGLLLHSVFNPSLPPLPTTEPPHIPPAASSRGAIPASIFPTFKQLLNPNPKGRLSAKAFLEIGMAETGFFSNNRLVKVCAGLDNFALANEPEKNQLLRTLKESASSFPPEFASHRVLPSLLSALEFGGASGATILPLVLQFGNNVDPEDYAKVILAPITKLFASPDRGTRMALLEHLPEYVDKLDKKSVSDKIFPHLQLGFSDTVPVIREATLKSIILLAPKLTDRLLNNDLLRLLAKTQSDTEPSIRTNTCILIGRLGPTLGYNSKRKILVPAFSRALKDSFVHARVAGLMAFMATIDCFEISELASKVIPNMAFTLIDEEKLVRDQAFKALDLFVKKLEEYASSMPETVIVNDNPSGGLAPLPTTLVDSASGAAGSLAGWAISSLSRKLATADMQAPINSAAGLDIDRSSSAPNTSSIGSNIAEISRPTFFKPTHSFQTLPGSNGTSKTKAMQLGANKTTAKLAFGVLPTELADEAALAEDSLWATPPSSSHPRSETGQLDTGHNPWGTDDLIDVNADEDDWSAFESAPVKTPTKAVDSRTTSLSRSSGSSWMTDQDSKKNGSLNSGQIAQTTPAQLGKAMSTQRFQSPALFPGTKSRQNDMGCDTVDTWESPVEKVSSVPTRAPAGQTIVPKEVKALEIARRKEERKQRIAMLKEQKKTGGKI